MPEIITVTNDDGTTSEMTKEGVEEACEVAQALMTEPSRRARIGHVTSLTIAGKPLKGDMSLWHPIWANLDEKKRTTYPPIVGIIQKASWGGGKTDPITIEMLISAKNWQLATNVEYAEDEGAEDDQVYEEATFSFACYDYDPVQKLVYPSFHCDEVELGGLFRFNDQDYVVATTAYEPIQSPRLYALKVVFQPKLVEEHLFVGFGYRRAVSKVWGDASKKALEAAQKAEQERVSRKIAKKKEEEEAARKKWEEEHQEEAEERARQEREEEALEEEQERLRKLEEEAAKREEKIAALLEKAGAAEEAARAAEALADEEARAATILAAAKGAAELCDAEVDDIRERYAEERRRVERERDAALVEYDKQAAEDLKKVREEEWKGEVAAYDADFSVDEGKKKAREAVEKAQMELHQAKGKFWKVAQQQLDAAILEIDRQERGGKLDRVQAANARRKVKAELDAKWAAQEGPYQDKVKALEEELAGYETSSFSARTEREQALAGHKREVDAAEKRRREARTAFAAPWTARLKELADREAEEIAGAKRKESAAEARVAELEAERERAKRERADEDRRARTLAEEAAIARVEKIVLDCEAAASRRIAEAYAVAERASIAAELAASKAGEAARTLERQAEKMRRLERELEEARGVAERSALALSGHDFRQDLSLALALTIDGKETKIPGGSVSSLSVSAETWGYRAEVEFLVALDSKKDELNASFTGTKLIEVSLAVKAKFQPETEPPDALTLEGIATERRVVEDSYDAIADAKVLRRRYRVVFADPAQVLWTQHRPTELFNEKKLEDVVDAHKGAKITITGDWAGHWDKVKKFIFLGLGDEANRASFYDFLVWYLERNRGVLTYDTAKNTYAVAGAKPASGTAKKLTADDIDRVDVRFPEVPRHAAAVLNAWSEAATKKKDITFDDAVSGVRRDILVRTEVASRFDARGTLETARLVARKAEVCLVFARFPTITFAPGALLDFSSDTWAADIFSKSKTYRARTYSIRARSVESPDRTSQGSAYGLFDCRIEAVLEEKEDTAPHLPAYTTPRWPVLVEGKIISEQGAEKDETYQFYTDGDTSIDQYKAKVPLFADKTVLVDYNPNLMPGHFYFPAFKNARVLLALEYDRAWIKRFLDWRPNARLPADGQGNHILLGKSDKDHTTINHVYVDEKPVLNVKRLQEKDTQTIVLKDGTLTIEVKEESA